MSKIYKDPEKISLCGAFVAESFVGGKRGRIVLTSISIIPIFIPADITFIISIALNIIIFL